MFFALLSFNPLLKQANPHPHCAEMMNLNCQHLHVYVFLSEKTQVVVAHNTEEGEDQEAEVEVVLLVDDKVMQLAEMVEEMVTRMLLTTMASKDGEGIEVLTDETDLQVNAMVEAGEVVVVIMMEEVLVTHLMITMATEQNAEITVDSGCTT